MANSSTTNFIQLSSDGQSVIIPPSTLSSNSYTAKSFVSATTCEMATNNCTILDVDCETCSTYAYQCTSPNLSGNLADSDLYLPYGAAASLSIRFYNSSSKSIHDYTPETYHAFNGTIWFAFPFTLGGAEPTYTTNFTNSSLPYDPTLQLFGKSDAYGFMSCTTHLSDITYASADNSLTTLTSTPMNDTASTPFFQTISQGFGKSFLEAGLNIASAQAGTNVELSYEFARVFDRTILGLTSGILLEEEALEMFQAQSKMVARVPVAEFVLLIVLNLVLTGLGVMMAGWALSVVRRTDVSELQAKMGLGALITELFDADTAAQAASSFAKRRLSTSRIAVHQGRLGRTFTLFEKEIVKQRQNPTDQKNGCDNNTSKQFHVSPRTA